MMASILSYGKVNEADNERLMAHRKTRKRTTIIALSSLVLVLVLVAAVVGVTQSKDDNNSGSRNDQTTTSTSIKAACGVTLYPDSCYNAIAPLAKSGKISPEDVFKLSVQVAINEISRANLTSFSENGESKKLINVTDKTALAALESCRELLSLALYHLNSTLSVADHMNLLQVFDDLRTWLSSAGTCLETCIDGFEINPANSVKNFVHENLKNSAELTSNSLAIVSALDSTVKSIADLAPSARRRLMTSDDDNQDQEAPMDRRLLAVQAKTSSNIKVDAVVAKDGSGKYKTIKAALKAVPENSKKRFVIYVKKGVYYENVIVEKSKWNVMMIGDGKDTTVVSGSLNFIDGTPTFQTATFAVFGPGFIARNMGFYNTAGAIKHQAVALMSSADMTVFHRCRIDAFQDTLYAHSGRQFYKECDIYGTVDFIFGNAAAVLQNCNIFVKKPIPGQQITITAQGKIDPNQNTGIVIQQGTVWPSANANLTGVQTYLGRPWKNYSTTVYMKNNMGGLIDPKGWLPWIGSDAPSTIFYAEYQNFGVSAGIKNRVNWRGLRLYLNAKQVGVFTVNPFINGNKWLPATGVNFQPGV